MTAPSSFPPRSPEAVAADRALVARLMARDPDAWTRVVDEMVLPPLLKNPKWNEMLRRLQIHPRTVAAEVCRSLLLDDCAALREFRFECALSSRVYDKIRGAVKSFWEDCKKEAHRLSELDKQDAQTKQTDFTPYMHVRARERLEAANRHLAALWDAKPVRAIVLLLCNVYGLRAKEVAGILGLKSENVDQIRNRAQKHLQSIAKGAPDEDR